MSEINIQKWNVEGSSFLGLGRHFLNLGFID